MIEHYCFARDNSRVVRNTHPNIHFVNKQHNGERVTISCSTTIESRVRNYVNGHAAYDTGF